jgi:hypothetical protein
MEEREWKEIKNAKLWKPLRQAQGREGRLFGLDYTC